MTSRRLCSIPISNGISPDEANSEGSAARAPGAGAADFGELDI
jgi:hypothetical protein